MTGPELDKWQEHYSKPETICLWMGLWKDLESFSLLWLFKQSWEYQLRQNFDCFNRTVEINRFFSNAWVLFHKMPLPLELVMVCACCVPIRKPAGWMSSLLISFVSIKVWLVKCMEIQVTWWELHIHAFLDFLPAYFCGILHLHSAASPFLRNVPH